MYSRHLMTWLLVLGTVSKIYGDVVCGSGDDLLPNPLDCNSFYQCANGVPILFRCASDHEGKPLLVFNPNLKQCVYPHEYDCSTTSEPSTDPPIQTPTDPPTEPPIDPPTKTTTDSPTPEFPGGGVVCSPDDDLLPNPIDCNSFYQCANGVPVLLHCASDHEGKPLLVFNPNLKQCVYPHEYDCSTTSEPSTDPPTRTTTDRITEQPIDPPTEPPIDPPTQSTTDSPPPEVPGGGVVCSPGDELLPNPIDCNSFYQCANGVPVLFHCASDHEGKPLLVFNPNLKQCVYPHEYDCSSTSEPSTDPPTQTSTDPPMEPPIDPPTQTTTGSPTPEVPGGGVVCSPGDDLLPNPIDCNSFYQCANGVPVLFHCASDHEGKPLLVFNPKLKQCVYPHEYDCSTTSEPSTDPPTQTTTDRITEQPIDPPTEPPIDPPTEPPIDPPTQTTIDSPEVPGGVICSPGDDLLPNPIDCNSFYQCANGVPVLFHCASDHEGKPLLVFNPNLKQCVYPHEYDCSTTTEPPTDFSTQTPAEPPYEPPTTPEYTVECEYEYLPNPDDCSSFYKCSNGVSTLFYCAPTHEGEPPLNFSPEKNVCVWPEEYPCQCHNKTDSISCLSTRLTSSRNCSFCFDNCFSTDFGVDTPQCDSYENLAKIGCTSIDDSGCDRSVELRPDCENSLEICHPDGKRNITVTFSIEKHPLDLYYLMDYSGSMHDDKDNLILLSSGLLETLSTLTDNFTIGFGSFIDKPRFPFGNISENDYSFHNNLPLTSETGNFVQRVREAPILLPNACDVPEAHADAMAQVMECPTAIGWRENARRVVLVATDAIFHTAGDGPLGNIYAPYVDGCYLDQNGFYTEQLRMDYPSVAQLAKAYSKKQATTTVIFATNTSTLWFYESVASQFKSAYVAILNTDSSNILDVVRSEFAKIQSKMEIEKSDTNDNVHFKYFSNCMGTGGARETKICENLPPSGNVTFTVEIDLDKCPTDENDTGMDFILNPVGLPRFFKVKLKFLCKTGLI